MVLRRLLVGLWGVVALASVVAAEVAIRGRVNLGPTAQGTRVEARLLPEISDHALGLLALEGKWAPEAVVSTEVDDSGRFELAAPGVGMWRLRLAAPGYLAQEFHLRPLLGPIELPAVELAEETPVEIKVVDDNGEPIASARVGASVRRDPARRRWPAFSRWVPVRRGATTDENGRALLSRGDGERLEISVFEKSFLEPKSVTTEGEPVRFELERAPRRVGVEVRGLGRAETGSLVRLNGWSVGLTNEVGRLELAVPSGQPLEVRASTADGSSGSQNAELEDSSKPESPLVIRLSAPVEFSGTVVDAEARRPVAGALVWVTREFSAWAETDAAGGYTLPLLPSRAGYRRSVSAAAEGYFPGSAEIVDRGSSMPTVALIPSIRLLGVVRNSSGDPLSEVEVTARAAPSRAKVSRVAMRNPPALSYSGSAGGFVLSPLVPGHRYTVRAKLEGYATTEVEAAGLEAGRDRVGFEIVLTQGAAAFGRIVDTDGAPVAGAEVSLARSSAGGESLSRLLMSRYQEPLRESVRTDEDGKYEIPHVTAGSYDLEVEAAGFVRVEVLALEILPGSTDLGTTALEPGAAVGGLIVNREGEPLAGAEVSGTRNDMRMLSRSSFSPFESGVSAITDERGEFHLEDLAAGSEISLMIRLDGYGEQSVPGVKVPTSEPLEIVLERSARVSGRVLGANRQPVEGARVRVLVRRTIAGGFSSSSGQGTAETDGDGEFEIENVSPGPLRLTVNAEGWRTSALEDLEVAAGEAVSGLEIVLERGATITGRVLGSNGEPVSEAFVSIHVEPGARASFMRGAFSRSDGDGRYRLEGVEPGLRQVVAKDADRQLVRELEVALGENRLDLVFEAGTEVAGRVVGDDGSPVGGALVRLVAPSEFMSFGGAGQETGPDGAFRFSDVPDGSFQFHVEKQGYAPAVSGAAFEVAGTPLSGIEIRLEAGTTVRGRLLGLEDAAIRNVQVYAVQMTPRKLGLGLVRPDGSYEVEGLSAGEWLIAARIEATGQTAEARIEISAGASEQTLDLEFTAGLTLTGTVLRDGRPVAGVQLGIRGLEAQWMGRTATDHEGRFRASGLKPGPHEVSVAGAHTEVVSMSGDEDIVIDLSTVRVTGYVLDAVTSEPIVGTSVKLEPLQPVAEDMPRIWRGSETTDSEGFFRIEEVGSGDYRLRAEKSGYASGELALAVGTDTSLEGLELRLSANRGILIQVVSASGGAPQSVVVAVVKDGRAFETGRYPSIGQGRVRLSTVPPGDWEVLVLAPGFAVSAVEAKSPSPAPVPVTLTPEARLEVVVPEIVGESVKAEVRLIGPDGKSLRVPSWGELRDRWPLYLGTTVVGGVPDGQWLIRAEAGDGRSWERTIIARGGTLERVELR